MIIIHNIDTDILEEQVHKLKKPLIQKSIRDFFRFISRLRFQQN